MSPHSQPWSMQCRKISRHQGILSWYFGASCQRDSGALVTDEAIKSMRMAARYWWNKMLSCGGAACHRYAQEDVAPRVSSVQGHNMAHFLLEIQKEVGGGHLPAPRCLCLPCNSILLAWSHLNKRGIYCQVIKCQNSLRDARMKTVFTPASLSSFPPDWSLKSSVFH